MLNTINYSLPGDLEAALQTEIENWRSQDKIQRIWSRDASVWTSDDEADWLGWLDIVDEELDGLKKYQDLRSEITSAGFKDILLMGMGGSSLCPEVLAMTFGVETFHILDSTVPAQVKAVEGRLDLTKTLFIVASKSGSTLEPNCFKQYFFERVSAMVGAGKAGAQFIAITDPGSKMEQIAKDEGFRRIFYGKPDIGGRFSALSAFGMVPAALMGLNVEEFLRRAGEMVAACSTKDPSLNPGALLGAILGVCHASGRDKMTIIASPEIAGLGAWLEQLVAESTGKSGVAIIPVDREPLIDPELYGSDRLFIDLSLKDSAAQDHADLIKAGHPVVMIELESINSLGQEFFRWEFATAVAGAIMTINPFNQPDVESAKIEARKITDEYELTGELPSESPFFEADGIALFTGNEYSAELKGLVDEESIAGFLEAHTWNVEDGDYFAILAYIEMNAESEARVRNIRSTVLDHNGSATCVGFGPRFLHSTGQAYKGGANNGVFLQITSDDATDITVPGQKYTFGIVKAAQSRGDFQVLLNRGRRSLRVHLTADVKEGLERLKSII